jgi:hypothetical protein
VVTPAPVFRYPLIRTLVDPIMNMSTTTGSFAAPENAPDAIVDEILRRRLTGAGRQDQRLRRAEERELLLTLAHLLDGADVDAYLQKSVRRRGHVPRATTGAT